MLTTKYVYHLNYVYYSNNTKSMKMYKLQQINGCTWILAIEWVHLSDNKQYYLIVGKQIPTM